MNILELSEWMNELTENAVVALCKYYINVLPSTLLALLQIERLSHNIPFNSSWGMRCHTQKGENACTPHKLWEADVPRHHRCAYVAQRWVDSQYEFHGARLVSLELEPYPPERPLSLTKSVFWPTLRQPWNKSSLLTHFSLQPFMS